jgi:hypothetical protein
MSTVPPPSDSSSQQFTSGKDAKAHAKAAKAYQKASRPWFKKKRFWLLGVIALLIIFSIAAQGGDDPETATDTPTQSAGQQPTDDAASDESAAEESTEAEETSAEESSAEESSAEEAPAEEAMVVSARQLIDDLEGNALKAKTTYEGKLVTVTGYVGSIDASGDYFSLDPEPDAIVFTGVQIQLDESHIETVSNYTQGQEVTVTGKVTSVGEIMGYSVDADTLE